MANVRSMTGHGTAEGVWEGRRLGVEIRSVNGRFREFQVRLPRLLAGAEVRVREVLASRVGRGSLTVTVNLDESSPATAHDLPRRIPLLAAELRSVAQASGLGDREPTISEVLQWAALRRSEVEAESADLDPLPVLEPLLVRALEEFDGFRQREGAVLVEDLTARLGRIEEALARIPALAREHVAQWTQQLRERIRALLDGAAPDEGRIAQEVAHLADRLDVDEEMIRFGAHNAAFRKILLDGGSVGKKLGFLLQEMLREVNTTGSKCQNASIAHLVVAIKDELESMKEQLANIE